MSRDLLTQLAEYGEYCEHQQESITVAEIRRSAAFDTPGSAEHEDGPTIDHVVPSRGDTPPAGPKWRLGAVLAVAAAILVAVGLVVADRADDLVTDRADDLVTEPASPSTATYRWSRIPTDDDAVFGGGFEQVMTGVTVGGPGIVAVGQAGAAIPRAAVWTSPDGISWSRAPDGGGVFDRGAMSGITAGGPGLVAVGVASGDGSGDDDAAVWTSVDGITWSRVAHDETVFGGAAMTSVTAGGPGLVAVGWDGHPHQEDSNAVVWTSVDGLTWSRVPHDEAIFGSDPGAWMWDIVAGGPGLVAVGDAGWADGWGAAVWTSVDGITWARVPHNEAILEGAGMRSVAAGGPGLVAVGHDPRVGAAVWTSPDGITWSRVPHNEAVFGGEGATMETVSAVGAGLVAGGWDATGAVVWTSLDGFTWSRVPHDNMIFGAQPKPVLEVRSIIAAGPGLVAVGSNGVVPTSGATDSDAAVWVATLD